MATCIQNADEATTEYLQKVRRDTWRELVATCFNLEVDDIPTLSIVDARNLMHKVSTKMIEPDTLMEIQQKASKIQGTYIFVRIIFMMVDCCCCGGGIGGRLPGLLSPFSFQLLSEISGSLYLNL